jgi:adenylate kinase family enzyme
MDKAGRPDLKAIVIGASCAGKTTLVRYLRARSDLPLLEIDDELVRENGGEYPSDYQHKHQVVAPRVIEQVLRKDSIVFFTNTDYFTDADLSLARSREFKIIQLEIPLTVLRDRNCRRVKEERYPDIGEWLNHMVEYQDKLREQGLVDHVISTRTTVEAVAAELLIHLGLNPGQLNRGH